MNSEEQALRIRRMRNAELMPLIVRLQSAEDVDIFQACMAWDSDDIQFAQSTRLGRLIVEIFNAIDPAQIGKWVEEGTITWE